MKQNHPQGGKFLDEFERFQPFPQEVIYIDSKSNEPKKQEKSLKEVKQKEIKRREPVYPRREKNNVIFIDDSTISSSMSGLTKDSILSVDKKTIDLCSNSSIESIERFEYDNGIPFFSEDSLVKIEEPLEVEKPKKHGKCVAIMEEPNKKKKKKKKKKKLFKPPSININLNVPPFNSKFFSTLDEVAAKPTLDRVEKEIPPPVHDLLEDVSCDNEATLDEVAFSGSQEWELTERGRCLNLAAHLGDEHRVTVFVEHKTKGKIERKGGLFTSAAGLFLIKNYIEENCSLEIPDFPLESTMCVFNGTLKNSKVINFDDITNKQGNWGKKGKLTGTRPVYFNVRLNPQMKRKLAKFESECECSGEKYEKYVIEEATKRFAKIKMVKRTYVFDKIDEGIPRRTIFQFGKRFLCFWFMVESDSWKKWEVEPHGNFKGKSNNTNYTRISSTQKKKLIEDLESGKSVKQVHQHQFSQFAEGKESFTLKKNAIRNQMNIVKNKKLEKTIGKENLSMSSIEFLQAQQKVDINSRVVHCLRTNGASDISFILTLKDLCEYGIKITTQKDCRPIAWDETFKVLIQDLHLIPFYFRCPFQVKEPTYCWIAYCTTEVTHDAIFRCFGDLNGLFLKWFKKSVYDIKFHHVDGDQASEKCVEMLKALSKTKSCNLVSGRFHFFKNLEKRINDFKNKYVGDKEMNFSLFLQRMKDMSSGPFSRDYNFFWEEFEKLENLIGGKTSKLAISIRKSLSNRDKLIGLTSDIHKEAGLDFTKIGAENYYESAHGSEIKSLLKGKKVELKEFIFVCKEVFKGNLGKIKASILGKNHEYPLKPNYSNMRVFHKISLNAAKNDIFRAGDSYQVEGMMEVLRQTKIFEHISEDYLHPRVKGAFDLLAEGSISKVKDNQWAVVSNRNNMIYSVLKTNEHVLKCNCPDSGGNERGSSKKICKHTLGVIFFDFKDIILFKTLDFYKKESNMWLDKLTGKFVTEKKNIQKKKMKRKKYKSQSFSKTIAKSKFDEVVENSISREKTWNEKEVVIDSK